MNENIGKASSGQLNQVEHNGHLMRVTKELVAARQQLEELEYKTRSMAGRILGFEPEQAPEAVDRCEPDNDLDKLELVLAGIRGTIELVQHNVQRLESL